MYLTEPEEEAQSSSRLLTKIVEESQSPYLSRNDTEISDTSQKQLRMGKYEFEGMTLPMCEELACECH
jgi:hypothetical protein